MSTICPEKNYRWPSPNHQGTHVRASSLVTFTDSDVSDTDIDDYDDTGIDTDTDTIIDNITDIDLKNSREQIGPALKRNAGVSPLTRAASPAVGSGNPVSSVPDDAMAETSELTSIGSSFDIWWAYESTIHQAYFLTHSSAICLESLLDEDLIRRLQCGHIFYSNCFGQWFFGHDTCPICKSWIVADQFHCNMAA
jgi:hypothetical protein